MSQGEDWRVVASVGWHLLGLATEIRDARPERYDAAGMAVKVRTEIERLGGMVHGGNGNGRDDGGLPALAAEQDGTNDDDLRGPGTAARGHGVLASR